LIYTLVFGFCYHNFTSFKIIRQKYTLIQPISPSNDTFFIFLLPLWLRQKTKEEIELKVMEARLSGPRPIYPRVGTCHVCHKSQSTHCTLFGLPAISSPFSWILIRSFDHKIGSHSSQQTGHIGHKFTIRIRRQCFPNQSCSCFATHMMHVSQYKIF
jgi:hypothetical protein